MSWKKNTVNSAAGIEQHILFFFNLLLFSFACVWLMVQDFIFGNVISAHNTVAERLWVDAWLWSDFMFPKMLIKWPSKVTINK